jgi:hypothetical protein
MSKYQLGVISEYYRAGRDEDGEDYIAEVYLVVAEFVDGSRFTHPSTFKGAKYYSNEDTFGYEDIRDEARSEACKVLHSLPNDIDFSTWFESAPRYGSESYQNRCNL